MKKSIVTVFVISALSLLHLSPCFAASLHLNDIDGAPGFKQAAAVQDSIYWRHSTYNAANLDTDTPNNHAWWCGTWYTPTCPPDPPEGYGNNWDQTLRWDHPVDDPNLPATVRVLAQLNHDIEPGYDYLYLDAQTADGWLTLASWDGIGVGVDVDETVDLQPGDFTGGGDRVRLRFRFVSDGAWSDVD